jgi:hypothetical protein
LIIGDDSNINEVIQELKGYNFDGSLGKVPNIKVHLDLKPNSKPFVLGPTRYKIISLILPAKK